MINPYFLVAVLVALIGAGVGGFRLGVDHEKASQVDQQALIASAVSAASDAAAQAIAQIKIKNTTIHSEVQHEIREKVVYAECRHSADGMRLVNQAINPDAAPAGGGELPKADAAQ